MVTQISGWGRYPKIEAQSCSFELISELENCLSNAGSVIARGLGRSYGDSSLNDRVVSTRRFNRMLDFDESTGIVCCEAGVSLSELISVFLPRGWFLPVTPGTKYVTVGGAVASDVHGKDHHSAGCFSQAVVALDLLQASGEIVTCSHHHNQELFRATCGGMGLTGIILNVSIALKKIIGSVIDQTLVKAACLTGIFDLFDQYDQSTYSVAWIDCLARGKHRGRSLLMTGEWAEADPPPIAPSSKSFSIPLELPAICLNAYSVSLFNFLYYHRVRSEVSVQKVPFDKFFYPLDSISNWNRIYGKSGFLQYQFVIPKQAGFTALNQILKLISDAGMGSFLAVLKLFGEKNPNYLSFPLKGYTLALDFKIESKLFALLDRLDDIVIDHGGRVYLTKDVRIDCKSFEKGYPDLEKFKSIRHKVDPHRKFQSLQSKRLGL